MELINFLKAFIKVLFIGLSFGRITLIHDWFEEGVWESCWSFERVFGSWVFIPL